MSRILIVEDTFSPSSPVRKLLRRAGHAVETAANTEVMWDLLMRQPADLIILDLPEESGMHVARLLREALPQAGLVLVRHDGAGRCGSDGMPPEDASAQPAWIAQLSAEIRALQRQARPGAGRHDMPGCTPASAAQPLAARAA